MQCRNIGNTTNEGHMISIPSNEHSSIDKNVTFDVHWGDTREEAMKKEKKKRLINRARRVMEANRGLSPSQTPRK